MTGASSSLFWRFRRGKIGRAKERNLSEKPDEYDFLQNVIRKRGILNEKGWTQTTGRKGPVKKNVRPP